ncbi:helix-turn-helix domain-containing protein [Parasphingorhabdus sp.]
MLAFEAGIHRTYISDLERGARNPTIRLVEKLAQALEVSAGELLD